MYFLFLTCLLELLIEKTLKDRPGPGGPGWPGAKMKNGATSTVSLESPSSWIVASKSVLESQEIDRPKSFREYTTNYWYM